MRIALFFILAMFLAAAFAADTVSAVEDFDGVRVTRSITAYSYDRTLYRTSPDAGVVETDYGSIVTLTLLNMRSEPLQKVEFTEDLAWIPSTKTVTFSVAPDNNDGRRATWFVSSLGAGQQVKITYNVDGALNPENAKTLALPKFTFQENKAVLSATRNVRQGETVRLALSTTDGKPAAGAKIKVSTPSGENLVLQSDAFGKVDYTPVDSGFYTYGVEGFIVDFLPTTQVEQVLMSSPPAAAAAVPKNEESVLAVLSGIWPIAGAVLLVGLVAFALYAYLNTSPKEEDAPAGTSFEPSSARQEASTQQDGMKYSISYGKDGAPPDAGSADEVKEQTRSLVEMRKSQAEKPEYEEAAVTETSELAAREVFESKQAEHDESLPQWMKGTQESYEGEGTVVDDDTIQKTIAELEQLRAQLRERQESSKAGAQEAARQPQEPEEPEPADKKKPRLYPKKEAKGKGKRR